MEDKREIHLKDYIDQRIHMIGITGSSMSGLAVMLKDMGFHHVTGSCDRESSKVDELRKKGIPVTVGHSAENVHGASLIVYTTAVPNDHVELMECQRLGIPVIGRPAFLAAIAQAYEQTIAICGTHGKTTTTSMIATILLDAGRDPSVHIGGELDSIHGSVRVGQSDIFLTEACEYKRAFLELSPKYEVILNIDRDHLDCYRDIDEIEEVFGQFMDRLSSDGMIIGNGRDPRIVHLVQHQNKNFRLFGWEETCDYYPQRYEEDAEGYASFDFCFQKQVLAHVKLGVPGRFNAENAFAALAMAHVFGVDMTEAGKSLESFHGAKRRFELTGVIHGAELFHDYGHNPVEIRNTVSIARKRCKGTLIVVLQPHTFSRVSLMFDEFAKCTEEADITFVTDIFQAREKDPGNLNSGDLVHAMKENGIQAFWTPTIQETAEQVLDYCRPGNLVITLGCGNVNLINNLIVKYSEEGKI